eukprot:g1884.t1
MKLYPETSNQLSPFLVRKTCVYLSLDVGVDDLEKYEDDARKLWNRFYQRNGTNFFKDRHYLLEEFPELTDTNPELWILETGCGVGNACFPLLESLPQSRICAVDFSSKAVELLEKNKEFDEQRIQTRVLDLTEFHEDFKGLINCPEMDFCLMVFFLSAVTPQKMPQVIRNLSTVMKSGGRVLFRDYAKGDLAQIRFEESGRQKKLGEDFYLRGDGTRCFYFTEQFLKSLFEQEGFHCQRITIFDKQIQNKARKLTMDRKWIQAVFVKVT